MAHFRAVPDINNRRRALPVPRSPRFLVYDDLNGKTFKEGQFGQAIMNLGNGDQGATVSLHREPLFGYVALKRLGMANHAGNERRYNQMTDDDDRQHMMRHTTREVELTPELTRHPHIADFYGYVQKDREPRTIGLLIEYMPGRSLRDLIVNKSPLLSDDRFIKRTLLHIARAVAYCHEEHNLVHRNIKPSNVLFSRDMQTAKLGDFCFARRVDRLQLSAKAGGSLRYMAPEVQLNDQEDAQYGKKADVYSFAMVAYAIAHAQEPFTNQEIANQHKFYQQLIDSNNPLSRPPVDPLIDPEVKAIIEQNWINEETDEEGVTMNNRLDMIDIVRLLEDSVEETP